MKRAVLLFAPLLFAACSPAAIAAKKQKGDGKPFDATVIADFDEPWAMTFLPEFNQALITEKKGKLLLWESGGPVTEIAGVPKVDYGGQGGFGDIILAPDYASSGLVYFSYVEAGAGDVRSAVVDRAKLNLTSAGGPALENIHRIWAQVPKVEGRGHFGHRLAFSPDGKYLFITSGERQKFDPAQDMAANLGKIVRLLPNGDIPADNPFAASGNPVQSQIWSLGHRNPLGISFDDRGRLWNQEMGPQGGDELNLVKPGLNYGYPKASNGSHYDGKDIPDHAPGDGFEAPKAWWNPSISPGGLMYYTGKLFSKWRGSMFIGGLSSKALIRVKIDGEAAIKADQWDMGARIREVEQSPDGAIWLLEDGANGSRGRLLKLTPKR